MPHLPKKMNSLRYLCIQMTTAHADRLIHVPIFEEIVSVLPPYLPEVISIKIVSHPAYTRTLDISLLPVIHEQLYHKSLVDILEKHCRLTGARVHFKISAVYEEDYKTVSNPDEERCRVTKEFVAGFSDLSRMPNLTAQVSVLGIPDINLLYSNGSHIV